MTKKTTPSDGRDPVGIEDRTAPGLLQLLVAEHPGAFTVEEIALQMIDEPPGDFAERDRVDRAIYTLIEAGLARRDGEYLRLTRPAVRAHQLLDL